MELKGINALVVGLGKTGGEVCRFLLSKGANVKVSDKRQAADLGESLIYWTQKGVEVEAGGHEKKTFMETDLIIPSPGVPPIPELKEAKRQGIKIISEIELAGYFLKGKIVGVTGSNGKSTTTTLAHKILLEGGLKSFLAGNIGTPLISYVQDSSEENVYVTELSSFQLEYTEKLNVPVSIVLNITPDHLDWHGTYENYIQAKKKLLHFQAEEDIAILNRDDARVWAMREEGKYQVYGFSRKIKIDKGCFIVDEYITLSNETENRLMEVIEVPLYGIHNLENVMAAAIAGHIFGIPLPLIKDSIMDFQGLEHRLEKVATINRIDFYNDSKATNVDAVISSIQSFKQKIILILGGKDKGGDFTRLKKLISRHCKKVILLGEAAEKIENMIKNSAPLVKTVSLKEAVESGYHSAEPGEIILLAPACTSFDMFRSFEERGKVFKKEVWALKENLEEKSG